MKFLIQKLARYSRFYSSEIDLIASAGLLTRRLDAREDVIAEGARPEVVNVVQQGWAAAYKTLEDGRRQTIAYFLPGDICDSNIFLIDEMDHSIGALTPLTVAEISRRGFEELAAEPRIHQALRWEGLVTAAIQREWTLSLGRRSALERMAHLFCELYMRLEAVGLTCHNSYELPITQTDLGEALGISTVHVNRTLQELRASDLIVFKERTLTILDFDGCSGMQCSTRTTYTSAARRGTAMPAKVTHPPGPGTKS